MRCIKDRYYIIPWIYKEGNDNHKRIMCLVWYGRRKWTAIIKTDVPGISLKSIFFFRFHFFFSKKPQRMYSIFIHSLPTPGNPFTISFLFVSECPVRKYMYIMYCVWAQCNCSKMRHFFSEDQKHKTTEGWRPKVVSMETVFFLFNFIFY